MELKLYFVCYWRFSTKLLIVPYGIETQDNGPYRKARKELLIVPYGIETNNIIQTLITLFTFNRTLWN